MNPQCLLFPIVLAFIRWTLQYCEGHKKSNGGGKIISAYAGETTCTPTTTSISEAFSSLVVVEKMEKKLSMSIWTHKLWSPYLSACLWNPVRKDRLNQCPPAKSLVGMSPKFSNSSSLGMSPPKNHRVKVSLSISKTVVCQALLAQRYNSTLVVPRHHS